MNSNEELNLGAIGGLLAILGVIILLTYLFFSESDNTSVSHKFKIRFEVEYGKRLD